MDSRKFQFTVLQLSSAKDKKISEGKANVPTNVLSPLASVFVIIFNRPARYLKVVILKLKHAQKT